MSDLLSPRKKPGSITIQKVCEQTQRQVKFYKRALNFIITVSMIIEGWLKQALQLYLDYRQKSKIVEGPASANFKRRTYEQYIQDLKLKPQNLGFTNNILYSQSKKAVNLYLPVYIACKVKGIQQVSVQDLTGNVNCAVLIHIRHGDLPEEIIQKLKSQVLIQFNRGDAVKLIADDIGITMKQNKKAKCLSFTMRKLFNAHILEDTLWSPFQILNLIISLTLNTVTIPAQANAEAPNNSSILIYNPTKQYKISFNCMRSSDKIPISYALDCAFGVYDLAERKLEVYYSKFGTFGEIMRNYDDFIQKKLNKAKGIEQKNKSDPSKSPQKIAENARNTLVSDLLVSGIMSLSIRKKEGEEKKKPDIKKVKYFQYTHFVIPLYKYPGNALATIFIPIFLLSLVSLAIYFQEPELSGRIGSIATLILGFIALIPSIKEQLPPSARITIVETMVYIQTLCCLLCLFKSFELRGVSSEDYQFIWYQDWNFLFCLFVHITCFLIIIVMYLIHKLVWQPSYNNDSKAPQNSPIDNLQCWDNPYCDAAFVNFNSDLIKKGLKDKDLQENIIRILPIKEKKEEKDIRQVKQIKNEKQIKEVKGENEKKEKKEQKQKRDSISKNNQTKSQKPIYFLSSFIKPHNFKVEIPAARSPQPQESLLSSVHTLLKTESLLKTE